MVRSLVLVRTIAARRSRAAWVSAGYIGVTGSVSIVASPTLRPSIVTGVKLEIGSVATPFNRQSLAKSLADCQRYFEMSYDLGTAIGTANVNGAAVGRVYAAEPFSVVSLVNFKATKRATPTLTIYSTNNGASGSIYNNSAGNISASITLNGMGAFAAQANNVSVAALTSNYCHWTASAEL